MQARLFGLLLIIGGLILSYYSEESNFDFFAGILIGAGVPFLLTGRFRYWQWRRKSHKG